MSFDERSHTLATLAVDVFGCLGVEGSQFMELLAASVVRGGVTGPWERMG